MRLSMSLVLVVLATMGAVTARDHHINDGNLQELVGDDFRDPADNFQFVGSSSRDPQEDLNNGFFQGNVLPRPTGFSSLAGFKFPPLPTIFESDLPKDESPHFSVSGFFPPDSLLTVDPEAISTEAPDLTTLTLVPSASSQFDGNPNRPLREPGRPVRQFGRRPPVRPRPNRRPTRFNEQRGAAPVAPVNAPRGIVRGGGGNFGRNSQTQVNEPGVSGFMKSFRRLIRTYI